MAKANWATALCSLQSAFYVHPHLSLTTILWTKYIAPPFYRKGNKPPDIKLFASHIVKNDKAGTQTQAFWLLFLNFAHSDIASFSPGRLKWLARISPKWLSQCQDWPSNPRSLYKTFSSKSLVSSPGTILQVFFRDVPRYTFTLKIPRLSQAFIY